VTRRFGLLGLVVILAGLPGCGTPTDPPPKVLVIGLDGATFDLLTPWMEQGELPRLRALRDGGISGELLSVIPPLSPPAWTTAATGVNPGKH
jgi:predicted AlkP superfamily phosphohydrolase/phosphomutase